MTNRVSGRGSTSPQNSAPKDSQMPSSMVLIFRAARRRQGTVSAPVSGFAAVEAFRQVSQIVVLEPHFLEPCENEKENEFTTSTAKAAPAVPPLCLPRAPCTVGCRQTRLSP